MIVRLLIAVLVTVVSSQQQKLTGDGDSLSPPIELQAGLLMVGSAYKGGSNFIVRLHGPSEDLIVNALGAYSGVRLVPVKAGSYRLQVQASAPWTLLYEQPAVSAKPTALPITQAMTGDAPLGPFVIPSGLVTATLTHSGSRNFIALLYHSDGRIASLLVNKLGAYSGAVAEKLTAGNYWLAVQADGPWTVTLK